MRGMLAAWLIGAALALGAFDAASAQGPAADQESPKGVWSHTNDGHTYAPPGVRFPTVVGDLRALQSRVLEDGSGGVLRYGDSATGRWVTVYLFRAGVLEADLLALAAENAVRERTGLVKIEDVAVPVTEGGPTAARHILLGRADRTGPAEGVLVARAGLWVVKVRVTAPDADQARRLGVETLAGVGLPDALRWVGVAGLEVSDCPAETSRRSALSVKMEGAAVLMRVVGLAKEAEKAETQSIYGFARACARRRVGGDPNRILVRGFDSKGAQAAMVLLLGDAGAAVEVRPDISLEGGTDYVVYMRSAKGTGVLGAYASWPTEKQILDLMK